MKIINQPPSLFIDCGYAISDIYGASQELIGEYLKTDKPQGPHFQLPLLQCFWPYATCRQPNLIFRGRVLSWS